MPENAIVHSYFCFFIADVEVCADVVPDAAVNIERTHVSRVGPAVPRHAAAQANLPKCETGSMFGAERFMGASKGVSLQVVVQWQVRSACTQ